jgi:hypothetical protein
MEIYRCCLQARRQNIPLLHLHRAVLRRIWIFLTGCISIRSKLSEGSRLSRLSSGHAPEHRVRPHRPCPPIKGHPKITLRSGSAPAEAPQTSTASSLWWLQTKISPATAPAGIPPSGGLRLQTPELLIQD